MRIDPLLRALRVDPGPQLAAQARVGAALAEWRADPACAGVLEELEDHGAGASLDTCPQLAALFAREGSGMALAGSLAARFVPVLAAEPFARMPFRQSANGPGASLVVGKAGRAVLTLTTRDPGRDEPEIAGFADGERHDQVLCGAGEGAIVRRRTGAGAFERAPVSLMPGTHLTLAMAREALLVTEVQRCLVTLRLTRVAARPQPTREYRLADGALLGQAAGDPRASRQEMMLAVLGRMGRTDAAPVMAGIAHDGCEHLRWQALRECLALDAAEGFRSLVAIARDPTDPLAAPAGAVRAQLLEAHPQLALFEEPPCPV